MREMPDSCVRHNTSTRLYCRTCGTPVCPRCMVDTPVGQKCPDCARPARSAYATKPKHFGRALGAGSLVALGSAIMLGLAGASGFAPFIRAGGIGLLTGEAVSWGSHRSPTQPYVVLATVLGGVASLATAVFDGRSIDGFQLLLAGLGAVFGYARIGIWR